MTRLDSPKRIAELMASQRFFEDDFTQPTDVLSGSIRKVEENAKVLEMTRRNPDKIYKTVKSKIAGNMKSIRKSQTRNQMQ